VEVWSFLWEQSWCLHKVSGVGRGRAGICVVQVCLFLARSCQKVKIEESVLVSILVGLGRFWSCSFVSLFVCSFVCLFVRLFVFAHPLNFSAFTR
jgi:hypothetical protein